MTGTDEEVGKVFVASGVYRIHSAVSSLTQNALMPIPMGFRTFAALNAFVTGTAATAAQLTQALDIAQATAWKEVGILERRGLVSRSGPRAAHNRRVTVTDKGMHVHRQAGALLRAAENRLADALDVTYAQLLLAVEQLVTAASAVALDPADRSDASTTARRTTSAAAPPRRAPRRSAHTS